MTFVTEGLIAIALGWLFNTGSRTLERRNALEQLLRGVSVSEAMQRDVPFVGPSLTIDTFANRFEGPDAVRGDAGGRRGPGGRRRRSTQARPARSPAVRRRRASDQVMATPPQAPFLAPDDALWEAVELMNAGALDGLAVADGGHLAGLVTRDGLADAIRIRAAAHAATGG